MAVPRTSAAPGIDSAPPTAGGAGRGASWLRAADYPVGVKVGAVAVLGLLTAVMVGLVGQRELGRADTQVTSLICTQA
jgi:hypothetical protein